MKCPRCGYSFHGHNTSRTEWVDTGEFWRVLEDFYSPGSPAIRKPMEINGVEPPKELHGYIHSLKRGHHARTRAEAAEKLLIAVDLDPHLVEGIRV